MIDKTGQTGQVDMDLSWQEPADGLRVTIELTGDILNAVRDQLGLKVERQCERVPVLVVERVSMPTANGGFSTLFTGSEMTPALASRILFSDVPLAGSTD